MAHPLPPHLGQSHFHSAFLAHHAAMLETLVLTAKTFVILDRAEDLGAEQSIALRLEGPVIDGFGLLHFAAAPGPDHLRRSQTNADSVEILDFVEQLERVQQLSHHLSPRVSIHTRLVNKRVKYAQALFGARRRRRIVFQFHVDPQ